MTIRHVVIVNEGNYLLRGPVYTLNLVSFMARAVMVVIISVSYSVNWMVMMVMMTVYLVMMMYTVYALPYYNIYVNMVKSAMFSIGIFLNGVLARRAYVGGDDGSEMYAIIPFTIVAFILPYMRYKSLENVMGGDGGEREHSTLVCRHHVVIVSSSCLGLFNNIRQMASRHVSSNTI